MSIEEAVIEKLRTLPPDKQRQVLDFARTLAAAEPVGIPGRSLLTFGGSIEPDDLQLMAQAIEEGCEQVDADEW